MPEVGEGRVLRYSACVGLMEMLEAEDRSKGDGGYVLRRCGAGMVEEEEERWGPRTWGSQLLTRISIRPTI